jgi:hypothetical protein
MEWGTLVGLQGAGVAETGSSAGSDTAAGHTAAAAAVGALQDDGASIEVACGEIVQEASHKGKVEEVDYVPEPPVPAGRGKGCVENN